MFGNIALIVCVGLIVWLLRKDLAWRKAGSLQLLIPGAWLAIQGSRPVAYWFGGGPDSVTTLSFGIFLVLAWMALAGRGLDWGALTGANKALVLIYAFFFLSTLWSDLPLASLKRVIKDSVSVLMVLILLAEARPAEAIRAVYVRVSYLLFPLSVVFIKYFPEIGRQVNRSGDSMFTGVTIQKNSLGETAFVFSLIILWDLWEILKEGNRPGRTQQVVIRAGMLAAGLWLLVTSDSRTSLLCLLLGVLIFWGAGHLTRLPNGKLILASVLAGVLGLVALDRTLGFSDAAISAMGRNPTLTGRTEIWRAVLEQQSGSLFLGHGFNAFWGAQGGEAVIGQLMQINSAHNGYLEAYVDGGLVGAALLAALLLAVGHRVGRRLFAGAPLGRIGLVFWFLALVYNLSESSFFRLDVLWFTFLLVGIECCLRRKVAMPEFPFAFARARPAYGPAQTSPPTI